MTEKWWMADCIWVCAWTGLGAGGKSVLREEAAGIVIAAERLVNQRKQFSKVKSVMSQKCQGDWGWKKYYLIWAEGGPFLVPRAWWWSSCFPFSPGKLEGQLWFTLTFQTTSKNRKHMICLWSAMSSEICKHIIISKVALCFNIRLSMLFSSKEGAKQIHLRKSFFYTCINNPTRRGGVNTNMMALV